MSTNPVDLSYASTSGFIPQAWAARALDVLRSRIVLAGTVARDTEYEPGWVGQQLNIPYPGTFTAQDKVADTIVTVQQPSGGATISLTLNKHKTVDFLVEDVARAQANTELLDKFVQPAAIALAEQFETDLITTAVSGFTGSPVGTPGTDITGAVIRAANRNLHQAKAPASDRHLLFSAKDEAAILADSTLTNYYAFAQSQAVRDATQVKLYGLETHMSQLVAIDEGTANVQTVTVGGSPTGGTFTLTVNVDGQGSQTTAAIAYNATAATVQAAIAALSNVGTGNVAVTGSAGGPWTVTFNGALLGMSVAAMTHTDSLTGGTSPAVTIAVTTAAATKNLAYHHDALMWAMRPFRDPPAGSGVEVGQMQDTQSGIMIRVLHQYDIQYRAVRVGFDILYGVVALRPSLGLIVNT